MSDGQGPDFNWLYTGKGKPPESGAPTSNPEATRAIPVQPRGATGDPSLTPRPGPARPGTADSRIQPAPVPGPADVPGQPPRQPPGGGTEYGRGRGGAPRPRRRRPRLRTIRRVVLLLLVAWVASLVWVGLGDVNAINRVAFEPSGARPADQPGTTYLIVGSDSRLGLTKKQKKKLAAGSDIGQRTDTIKLLHTGSGPTVMLTLPRDSYVPIPGRGSSKINAAFAWGGPELLVKTIEQNTGLRIDGYVEIGMGGLINLVDAVGGITICPTTKMTDPLARLKIKKGCQEADGFTALGYSRSRHAQKLGDLGRGQAQTEVIGQIGSKILKPARLLNPFALHALKPGIEGITAGKGMSSIAIAKFGLAFRSVSAGKALQCGIPISDMYIHWDKKRALEMLKYLKTDTTKSIPASLCTPSGLPKSVTG